MVDEPKETVTKCSPLAISNTVLAVSKDSVRINTCCPTLTDSLLSVPQIQ